MDVKQYVIMVLICISLMTTGNGTLLQYSCLENPMDGGAWKTAVHGVAEGQTWLSEFTFTFHFHALEKEMATHSSVLAWRIPGMGHPGGLPSMGSHRVRHDWSDSAGDYWLHTEEQGKSKTNKQEKSFLMETKQRSSVFKVLNIFVNEYLCMRSLAICTCPFVKFLFKPLAHFLSF